MNELPSNDRSGWGGMKYRRHRDTLVRRLNRWSVPKAEGLRYLVVTRLMGKGRREFDTANLVGGCKPLIDSLVKLGLLVDDNPRLLIATYRQQRHGTDGTMLELMEV